MMRKKRRHGVSSPVDLAWIHPVLVQCKQPNFPPRTWYLDICVPVKRQLVGINSALMFFFDRSSDGSPLTPKFSSGVYVEGKVWCKL